MTEKVFVCRWCQREFVIRLPKQNKHYKLCPPQRGATMSACEIKQAYYNGLTKYCKEVIATGTFDHIRAMRDRVLVLAELFGGLDIGPIGDLSGINNPESAD